MESVLPAITEKAQRILPRAQQEKPVLLFMWVYCLLMQNKRKTCETVQPNFNRADSFVRADSLETYKIETCSRCPKKEEY